MVELGLPGFGPSEPSRYLRKLKLLTRSLPRLSWENVRLQDGFAYLPNTKNSEPRSVFLPPVAVAAMEGVQGPLGRVWRFVKGGHLYSLPRTAAFKAGIDLPERSAFHIFRHTYATWMRREAGLDTKGLVATGAWKDRKSADRYEHVVGSEEARKAKLLPTPKDGAPGLVATGFYPE